MKRLLTLLLILGSITLAYATGYNHTETTEATSTTEINKRLAVKGYRGFVNYTPLIATFINDGIAGSVSTTHGYQFNHNYFAGIGVGFHINLGDEGLGVALPVYAAFKGNYGDKLAQLTYGARIGVAYADYGNFNSETSVHNGEAALAYFNANIGLRLGIAQYFAIIITPEIDLFVGRYNIAGAGLRVGFEF
ncbi:MAG: hypothetical protein E7084_03140 [Bacteroidales bacterium]|nr:hypothetical protein [Bacteroidales bacterium]MBP3670427.1 hypothetical protein [Bacteroidaceae bacterium]